ncbi:hypothetical protein FACS1894164_18820 [Spirochaetia bacterium]|nr:hypothetical protein FACS1894164_18820 [Spirochaetia bacterium]
MAYVIIAVFLMLGTILSGDKPVLSALIMLIADPSEDCITATIKTNTPIPPIQCAKLRQNNIPFGKLSISASIVAPVVVNPDVDSNTQSAKLLKCPEK